MPDRPRSVLVAAASAVLMAVVALIPAVATAAVSLPNSIAAAGDSITQAYNTGSGSFSDFPASSWSTGTTTSVNSHYLRLKAQNAGITGHAYNDSKSGARMVDLDGQLTTVASQHVDYVTILMGGNDVCRPTVAEMTPVTTFRSQFTTALQRFTAASPNTKILVVSIPNIQQLWALFKNNGSARFIWSIGKVCQSMLANPTSTATADVNRRAQVQQRNVDFNTQLAQVCAQFTQCRFDGNALFNTAFTTADVNTRDYFHPSTAGQAKVAAVTWAKSYWAP